MTIKEKIQLSIEQKISEWQEDDIYAVSLYVFDEEDDPCRPVAVLGYNTERQVQKSTLEASDEQEARWNYAFWLQNEEMCWGQGDTAEDVKEWITEQDLWDREDEIAPKFVGLLVAVVQDIHASGLLKDKFGRQILCGWEEQLRADVKTPILLNQNRMYGIMRIIPMRK